MRLAVFDRMEECGDAEIRRLLPSVSAQRREKALGYKHDFGRFACLKTYEMLQNLLFESRLIPDKGMELVFRELEHGKPVLRDFPDLHFNISHCRNALAVVVSENPVGIDIEAFRPFSEAVLRRTMNAKEAADILAAGDSSLRFTEYWTRKEAVLKLRGCGITEDLHHVLEGKEATETHVTEEKRYVFTLASDYLSPNSVSLL